MPDASRREQRERVLGLLYEADAKGLRGSQVIAELPVAPDEFVVDLVVGIESRVDEVDRLIADNAIDWTLDRMPVVDRSLLRMATYELLARPEVPTGAAISEAVELAKQYSTDESGRFVNGVLASVALKVRPARS